MCWPTWSAPTPASCASWPGTLTWPRRSRCWRAGTERLIWDRARQVQRLRALLREFFPAALDAFDDLTGPDALELLGRAPEPAAARRLTRTQIGAALRRARRHHRTARTEQIRDALHAEQLTGPAALTAASVLVRSYLVWRRRDEHGPRVADRTWDREAAAPAAPGPAGSTWRTRRVGVLLAMRHGVVT